MKSLEFKNYKVEIPGVESSICIEGSVPGRQVLCVHGVSGIGKSSLAYSLCGLRPKTETGSFSVSGKGLSGLEPKNRNVGVVFQGAQLFSHLSVVDNLLMAFERKASLKMLSKELKIQKIHASLEGFGLEALASKAASSLSGGEQQRVAFSRAVLSEPDFFVIDEGFSALDKTNAAAVANVLNTSMKDLGAPAIFFSHQKMPENVFDSVKTIEWKRQAKCLEF